MYQMVKHNRRPHHGQCTSPSAGVTLVAATNIHLHALGNVRGGLQVARGLAPPRHPSLATPDNVSRNRIERYSKSYSTISKIV